MKIESGAFANERSVLAKNQLDDDKVTRVQNTVLVTTSHI